MVHELELVTGLDAGRRHMNVLAGGSGARGQLIVQDLEFIGDDLDLRGIYHA
jgi:hypothetical protein